MRASTWTRTQTSQSCSGQPMRRVQVYVFLINHACIRLNAKKKFFFIDTCVSTSLEPHAHMLVLATWVCAQFLFAQPFLQNFFFREVDPHFFLIFMYLWELFWKKNFCPLDFFWEWKFLSKGFGKFLHGPSARTNFLSTKNYLQNKHKDWINKNFSHFTFLSRSFAKLVQKPPQTYLQLAWNT
jgi:hypothetical protein